MNTNRLLSVEAAEAATDAILDAARQEWMALSRAFETFSRLLKKRRYSTWHPSSFASEFCLLQRSIEPDTADTPASPSIDRTQFTATDRFAWAQDYRSSSSNFGWHDGWPFRHNPYTDPSSPYYSIFNAPSTSPYVYASNLDYPGCHW